MSRLPEASVPNIVQPTLVAPSPHVVQVDKRHFAMLALVGVSVDRMGTGGHFPADLENFLIDQFHLSNNMEWDDLMIILAP
jgi:hypothetical protein